MLKWIYGVKRRKDADGRQWEYGWAGRAGERGGWQQHTETTFRKYSEAWLPMESVVLAM